MGTEHDGLQQTQDNRQVLVCGCSASTGWAVADSGSSCRSSACNRRQQEYAAACHQQVTRHMRSRSSMSAVLLVTILLASLAGVWGVPTQCRKAPPVCPSRSEALARKPMFDMETPTHLHFEDSSSAGSSKHSLHKATAAGHQSPVSLLTGNAARKEGLFMRQGSAQNMPPQRVMPSGDLPAMSDKTQQQLFSQLQAVLQGEGASSIVGGAGGAPAPAAAVTPPKPGCAAPGGCGTLFLNNARLRVGVDTDRGGAISFVSSPVMPPEWANVNLVNTWDAGRLIQQSYYGCYDNTCWVDRPWRWNPVQGGSWQNGPPKLLTSRMGAASVTTASVPRNWGGQQLLDDVLMVTETELHPNVVKVRFTMRYTGTEPHPDAHQEVPAVFLNRRLNVLALYTGEKPWSNDELTFIMPGQMGEYYRPTERWAAYVDQASGFGLGVYTPVANQLVAYRIGPENSTARNDVSYMAPLVTANIQPNTEFSYDAYIAVGRVDEMRSWFAEIAARVAPKNEAGSYRRPIPTSLLPNNDPGGRSMDAARIPGSSLLFEPKTPAVKVTPGGADAVAFAKAAVTAGDIDIDTAAASPPRASLKLTPKPAKHSPPSPPAKAPSPAVSVPAEQHKPQPKAPAAAAHPQGKPLPNARLAAEATVSVAAVLPAQVAAEPLPAPDVPAQLTAPVAEAPLPAPIAAAPVPAPVPAPMPAPMPAPLPAPFAAAPVPPPFAAAPVPPPAAAASLPAPVVAAPLPATAVPAPLPAPLPAPVAAAPLPASLPAPVTAAPIPAPVAAPVAAAPVAASVAAAPVAAPVAAPPVAAPVAATPLPAPVAAAPLPAPVVPAPVAAAPLPAPIAAAPLPAPVAPAPLAAPIAAAPLTALVVPAPLPAPVAAAPLPIASAPAPLPAAAPLAPVPFAPVPLAPVPLPAAFAAAPVPFAPAPIAPVPMPAPFAAAPLQLVVQPTAPIAAIAPPAAPTVAPISTLGAQTVLQTPQAPEQQQAIKPPQRPGISLTVSRPGRPSAKQVQLPPYPAPAVLQTPAVQQQQQQAPPVLQQPAVQQAPVAQSKPATTPVAEQPGSEPEVNSRGLARVDPNSYPSVINTQPDSWKAPAGPGGAKAVVSEDMPFSSTADPATQPATQKVDQVPKAMPADQHTVPVQQQQEQKQDQQQQQTKPSADDATEEVIEEIIYEVVEEEEEEPAKHTEQPAKQTEQPAQSNKQAAQDKEQVAKDGKQAAQNDEKSVPAAEQPAAADDQSANSSEPEQEPEQQAQGDVQEQEEQEQQEVDAKWQGDSQQQQEEEEDYWRPPREEYMPQSSSPGDRSRLSADDWGRYIPGQGRPNVRRSAAQAFTNLRKHAQTLRRRAANAVAPDNGALESLKPQFVAKSGPVDTADLVPHDLVLHPMPRTPREAPEMLQAPVARRPPGHRAEPLAAAHEPRKAHSHSSEPHRAAHTRNVEPHKARTHSADAAKARAHGDDIRKARTQSAILHRISHTQELEQQKAARALELEQRTDTRAQGVEQQKAARAQDLNERLAARTQELEEQRAEHALDVEERRAAHAQRVQVQKLEAESRRAQTLSGQLARAQTHSVTKAEPRRAYGYGDVSYKASPRSPRTYQGTKATSAHLSSLHGLPVSQRDPLVDYLQSLEGMLDSSSSKDWAKRSSRSSSRPSRHVDVEELNEADRQAAADREALRAFREAKQRKQDHYAQLRSQASPVKQQGTINKPGKAGARIARARDSSKKKQPALLSAFTNMLTNLQDVLNEAIEPKTTVPSCADRKDSNSACV